MCNHISQNPCPPEGGLYRQLQILTQHLCSFVLKFLVRAPNKVLSRYTGADSHKGTLMYFHYFTDLMNEWRKYLTLEAGTPKMAVAPAAAFPSIVVPLIRMPE